MSFQHEPHIGIDHLTLNPATFISIVYLNNTLDLDGHLAIFHVSHVLLNMHSGVRLKVHGLIAYTNSLLVRLQVSAQSCKCGCSSRQYIEDLA